MFGSASGSSWAYSNQRISVTVPPGSVGTVSITIQSTTFGQTVASGAYTYNPLTTITSIVPSSAGNQGGTIITLYGTNLPFYNDITSITVAGVTASYTKQSQADKGGDMIRITLPPISAALAGTVNIVEISSTYGTVTVSGLFTLLAITSVTPSSGSLAGGTTVTIQGSFANLVDASSVTSVKLCNILATVVSASTSQIVVTSNPGTPANDNAEVVINSGAPAIKTLAFRYVAVSSSPPLISPTFGPLAGGNALTVFGTFGVSVYGDNANATADQIIVCTVGGKQASFNTAAGGVQPTQIAVTVPAGTSPGAVAVTVKIGTGTTLTSAQSYTYNIVPVLGSVVPSTGDWTGGNTITVTAANGYVLGSGSDITLVTVGGFQASSIVSQTATSVVAVVGSATSAASAGSAAVAVTSVSYGRSVDLTGQYAYTAITSLSPVNGPLNTAGNSLTVSGSFTYVSGVSSVVASIQGISSTVTFASTSTVVLSVPSTGAVALDASVSVAVSRNSNLGGASITTSGYFFMSIGSLSPRSGPSTGGNTIGIAGIFDTRGIAGSYSCSVGGVSGTISGTPVQSLIRCTVPAGTPGSAAVVIRSSNGASVTASQSYSYVSITAAVPVTGPVAGGNAVTIQGSFVGADPGISVTFNGATATVTSSSSSQIVVSAPAGSAGSANVSVTITAGAQATVAAVYSYVNVSTPLTPTNGPYVGGNSITISGSFPGVTSTSNVAVTIGGLAATATSASATAIVVTAPTTMNSAGAKSVSVTVRGGSPVVVSNAYTYNAAPVITSITPASGPWYGGKTVTVAGSNLGSGSDVTAVTIRSLPCTIVFQSASTVRCTTTTTGAASTAGASDVVTTSTSFGTGTLASGYAYQAITSVSPATGPATGGNSITLSGTFVGANSGTASTVTITFKTQTASVTVIPPSTSATTSSIIVITAPDAGAANTKGDTDVSFRIGTGDDVTVTSGYAFLSPFTPCLSQSSGPSTGQTLLTLDGVWGTINSVSEIVVVFGSAFASGVQATSVSTTPSIRTPAGTANTRVNAYMQLRGGSPVYLGTYDYNVGGSIGSVTPSRGPASSSYRITITGTNLASNLGDLVGVTLVGKTCTAITASTTEVVVTATQVTSNFTGSGTAVVVSNIYGTTTSAADIFAFVNVTSISPRNTGYNVPYTAAGQASTPVFSLSGYFGASAPSTSTSTVTVVPSTGGTLTGTVTGSTLSTLSFTIPSTLTSSSTGYANVSVVVNGGQAVVLANQFYLMGIVSSAPSSMSMSGGVTVTTTGFFDVNPAVGNVAVEVQNPTATSTFQSATVLSASSTQITWRAPSFGSPGKSNVRITVFGGYYVATSTNGISYVQISSVTPASGPTSGNYVITIAGVFVPASGLTSITASTAGVTVNGIAATLNTASSTTARLVVTVPSGTYSAGYATVNVTIHNTGQTPAANGGAVASSNTFAFVSVSSVSPSVGPLAGGNVATIFGVFSQVAGVADVTSVKFGASTATVVSASTTAIAATVPAGTAGSVSVTVAIKSGNPVTKSTAYQYNVAGGITSVSPTIGPVLGGARTTITGTSLGSGTDVTAVKFGGVAAAIVSQTSTTIIVTTGSGAPVGPASVVVTSTSFGDTTQAAAYTFASITTVTPDNGPTVGGNSVTIAGSFASAALASDLAVTLGGLAASITSFTAATGSIVVTAPSAVGQSVTTDVVVTIKSQSPVTLTNGYIFQSIAAVVPSTGPLAGGNSVTLVGQLRVSLPAECVITLTGQLAGSITPTAVVTLGSSKGVVFTVPGGAASNGTVGIALSINSGSPLTASYLLNPAAIVTSVMPRTGPIAGGAQVTITGQYLNNGTDTVGVTLGGVSATVVSQSSTQVVVASGATIIANANGFAPVITTSTAFGVGTLPSAYAYIGISSLFPASGPGTSSNRITIFGSFWGFSSPAEVVVTVGGSAATIDVAQSGFMIIRTPLQAGVNTNEAVSISVPPGAATLSPVNFAYLNITTVTPARGPRAGGNSVTLSGWFGSAATAQNTHVTVQGLSATVVSVASSQVVVKPAAGSTGAATIAVTVGSGNSLSVSGLYQMMPDPSITLSSVTPKSGPWFGNTSVSLTGVNLGTGTDIFSVTVAGVQALSITSQSDSGVTFVTGSLASPALGGRATIVVTSLFYGNATAANAYSYTAIESLVPSSGPVGGSNAITLLGYFGLSSGTDVTTATVGGQAVTVSSVDTSGTPEKIVLAQPATPPAAGNAVISVAILNGAAVTATYAYTGVTSLTPASGPVSATTVVTLAGFFGAATAGTVQVTVNGTRAGINSASSAQIVARFPALSTAGPADVAVTVSGGIATTAAAAFGYVRVVSVDRSSAQAGATSTVTIYGTFPGLSATSGAAVTVQGRPATVTAAGPTAIDVTLPGSGAVAGTADVSVQLTSPTAGVAHVAAAPFAFTQITSIAPATGPKAGGNTVTLFGVFPGASLSPAPTVTLFGATAAVAAASPSAIVFTAPTNLATAGLGDATVAIRYAGAAVDGFPATLASGYTSVQITSLAPQAVPAAGGVSVTLAGTFTGASAASDVTVFVAGVAAATVTAASPTSVTFTAPAGIAAGAANVTLRLLGGAPVLAPSNLIYSSVSITSVTPNNGPLGGANSVTIAGTGLTVSSTPVVTLKGVAATVSSSSATQVVVTAGAGTAGTGDVYVFSSDTGSATLANGYTYNSGSCVIDAVTPRRGPVTGGNSITISGSALTSGADLTAVDIGGVSLLGNCGTVTATQLVCTAQSAVAGGARTATVTVTSTSGGTCTSSGGYTYAPQGAVTGLVPSEGPVAGGTTVTISGSDLSEGLGDVTAASITFGTAAVASVLSASATRVVVVTGPGAAPATVAVSLVSLVHGTATLAAAFTYNPAGVITSVLPLEGPLRGGFPPQHSFLTVAVAGTNLCRNPGDLYGVSIAGIPVLRVVSANATSLVLVPGAANVTGSGPVVVSSAAYGVTTSTDTYTINPLPVVSSVTPSSGLVTGGNNITIGGANLAHSLADLIAVTVKGVPVAAVLSASETQIVVTTGDASVGGATAWGDGSVTTLSRAFGYAAGAATGPGSFFYIPTVSIAVTGSGADIWSVGATVSVQWVWSGYIPTVDVVIESCATSGLLYTAAAQAPNVGRQALVVPYVSASVGPVRARVSSGMDGRVYGLSACHLVVGQAASSTVIDPVSSTSTAQGASIRVRWYPASSAGPTVNVLLRQEGSNTVLKVLGAGVPNSGSLLATLPNVSGSAYVEVLPASGTGVSVAAAFTIP